MKQFILFLLCAYFISCEKEKNIDFITVGKGDVSVCLYEQGMDLGVERIIKTDAEWEMLKSKMNNKYNCLDNCLFEKDIDFSKEQLIVIIDKVLSGSSWTVDITDIKEYNNKIVVDISNMNEGNLLAVVRQPFHIVKIPISRKKIIFNDNRDEQRR
jgi:hypothetical protein